MTIAGGTKSRSASRLSCEMSVKVDSQANGAAASRWFYSSTATWRFLAIQQRYFQDNR